MLHDEENSLVFSSLDLTVERQKDIQAVVTNKK